MVDTLLLSFIWIPFIVVVAGIQMRRNASFGQTFGVLVLVTYLFALVGVTFFPFPIQPEVIADFRQTQYLNNNLIPFENFREVLAERSIDTALRQLGGNFILLMPLTVLLAALRPRFRSYKSALLIAFSASLGIELVQLTASTIYGFTWKIFDVDDIWLNVMGGFFGYASYSMAARILRVGARPFRKPINIVTEDEYDGYTTVTRKPAKRWFSERLD